MASSVVIAPTNGNAVMATDGTFANGNVWDIAGGGAGGSMLDLRRMAQGSACPQEGVIGDTDWKVTATNGDLTVTINANAGIAVVQGDDIVGQGRYTVAPHSADIVLDLADAPHGSLPRLDQVVLQVEDEGVDGGTANRAVAKIISGTATGGATKDNRTGAATLPDTCLLLCDILVSAGATQLVTADLRDRRRWAYGAHAYSYSAGGLASSTLAYTAIDSSNTTRRLEIASGLVRVTLQGYVESGSSVRTKLAARVDGVDQSWALSLSVAGAASDATGSGITYATVSAGSHLFVPSASFDGSGSVSGVVMLVEEIVRPNANNGTA